MVNTVTVIEWTKSNISWISVLLAALLGAIIGGVTNALGVYCFQRKHTQEQERKARLKLIQALYYELSSLLQRYMKVVGMRMEKAIYNGITEPQPVGILQSSHNYFVIFDNASISMGLLEKELAERVIQTYVYGKAYLDELQHYHQLHESTFNTPVPSAVLYDRLTGFFQNLKEDHIEVKGLFEDTINILQQLSHNISPH